MASKREELERIRAAVDDRLADRSDDFRERVIHWLDVVDAEIDGGLFDLHLSFAIHSVESEEDLRARALQVEQMRQAYLQSVQNHGEVFRQFRESGFVFSEVRDLVEQVGEQQAMGKKLDDRLVHIHNAVKRAIDRIEDSQPLVNRIALLGMAGLVGLLCFPTAWFLGRKRGFEAYGEQAHVLRAEFLWNLNSEQLDACLQRRPEPCSVSLKTGVDRN